MKLFNIIMLLILFIFIGSSNCRAQNNNIDKKQALQNKVWKIENTNSTLTFTFSSTVHFASLNNNLIGNSPFYLSDINCENEIFNQNKVGQSSNGKYLRMKKSCYEIEFLDENTFRLKDLNSLELKWITYVAIN